MSIQRKELENTSAIIFDRNLLAFEHTRKVIEQLKAQELDQKMKFASRELGIKNSIEWIIPKCDGEGERVSF